MRRKTSSTAAASGIRKTATVASVTLDEGVDAVEIVCGIPVLSARIGSAEVAVDDLDAELCR